MAKEKKDVLKIRRDFSVVVLDLYGVELQALEAGREQAMSKALKRFGEEAPVEAVELLNEIFREEGSKPMTLAVACAEALGGGYEDEKTMGMETRIKRFTLAQRILEGGIVEITTEERTQVQALLTKRFPGSVIAPRCSILLETEPVEAAEQTT